MVTEEKNERLDIMEGDQRVGCVSVRYPLFPEEYKRLNAFYEDLASSYIRFAEKKLPKIRKKLKFQGMFNAVLLCKLSCSDEKYICVHTEGRMYKANELFCLKSFSNVWRIPNCRLAYKRKKGIRKSSVGYNGKELFLYDK